MNSSKINIIVFNLNWLGDILFSTPGLLSLKTHHPQSHLACIVPPLYKELLESQKYIDEVIALSDKTILDKIKLVKYLKKKKWDIGYLFHRSKTRALLFKWGGIPKRLGYSTNQREHLLTEAIEEPPEPLHKMDYVLRLLEKTGIRPITQRYAFNPPIQKLSLPKPYIVFHPGANWPPKRWPTQYYAQLGDTLASTFRIQIVITGSATEKILAKEIQKGMRHEILDLTGKTPLPHLANIFYQSAAVVAGDTGPMHLASASGANVVSIYGPTSPLLNGPRSNENYQVIWENPGCERFPCHTPSCEHAFILKKISPSRIFETISSWKNFRERLNA